MNQVNTGNATPTRRLYRSRHDRKIAGVAGGLARHLDIDPGLTRMLLFLVLLTAAGPFGIVPYAIFALLIPREPEPSQVPATP
jgi:phage shock protein PspC (stress-responsive transcriptional regulator)